jgi:predicted TIM-barrel fold metal-dependent hydrolase
MDIKAVGSLISFRGNKHPKIDVHSHYIPDAYLEALIRHGEENTDGFPAPKWNAEEHIKVMNKLGIETSMISISSPHINFGDADEAAALIRKVNDFGAELAVQYNGRFRLMASLPVPYTKAAIEEMQRCKSDLRVDGFALPTNTRGTYLGSSEFDPVFKELNRVGAVVVLHPNKPGLVPAGVNEGLPIPAMEFLFDTTRTVTNMILKGTFEKYPDIKFVIPHAGAFLSLLADRLVLFLELGGKLKKGAIEKILKGLYYDLAGACLPRQLENLLELTGHEHLLYGSDTPYTPEPGCVILADALDKTKLLTDEQREDIYYNNAKGMFRFR